MEETTSTTTALEKQATRPGEKTGVGMKVDCRAVANFEADKKEVDLINMEAAKVYEDGKIMDDRSTLLAEAKCGIDYFLNSDQLDDEKKKKVCMPILQIAGPI